MRTLAFSVYDRAARAYSPPFYQQTRGLAERVFAGLCTDPDTTVAKNPGDFELYEVGEFDSETGVVQACEVTLLTTAVQTLSLRAVSNG